MDKTSSSPGVAQEVIENLLAIFEGRNWLKPGSYYLMGRCITKF